MQSGGRFPRMGMRAVGVLASWVVLALLPNLAVSLEPPRRGELKQYQEDDSLARRVEFSKRLMNHRFRAALVQRKAAQLQAIREGKPLPDAILPYEVGLPSSGAPKIFALLIDFSDYPSVNNVDSFQSKLFGTGDPSEFPVESLTEFYKRSSYGVLDIGGVVLGWYRARYSRDYYGAYDYSGVAELIKEALATFENSHDFTQYDNNGDVRSIISACSGPVLIQDGLRYGGAGAIRRAAFLPVIRSGSTASV